MPKTAIRDLAHNEIRTLVAVFKSHANDLFALDHGPVTRNVNERGCEKGIENVVISSKSSRLFQGFTYLNIRQEGDSNIFKSKHSLVKRDVNKGQLIVT